MKFYRVETVEEAKRLVQIMPNVIAVDTEYVKGDPRTTKLLSVIIADEDRAWACLPSLLPILTPSLRARTLIFLQDYNHCDTIILNSNGCDLRDTYCVNLIDMHHLQNENLEHGLGERVLATFGDNYKAEFWGTYKNFEDASHDEQLEYQCKDGIYTYRLGLMDINAIRDLGIINLYEHVRKTSRALVDTEIEGLPVNVELMQLTEWDMSGRINEYLPKLRGEFDEYCKLWELKKWAEEISKRTSVRGRSNVARPEFSFTSDKQLAEIIYSEECGLGLKPTSKTKKGNPSTDYDSLKRLAEEHPEIRTIVEYKEIKAVYSTFVKGMLERVENERIYPHFNVSGTDTGRLSHSNPNMGNLPTEGVIRNFFVASPGYSIIGADYAQLEVVIEANLTKDKQLLKIINEGASKHDITAQGLGITRDSAKTLNFALQYGAGAGKVGKLLGISTKEAETVFRRYWELYSGVAALKEATNKTLQEEGQVTNLFGRTRHFPKVTNKYEVYRQQRQAYNFLIQGVASDACNGAYWRFYQDMKQTGWGRTLFSVHDEIVAEAKYGAEEDAKARLEYHMQDMTTVLKLQYPLKAKTYGPIPYWRKT